MGVLTDKNVLVIGASGFIGTHLVKRLLKEEANVYAIDTEKPQNADISYLNAD